MKTAIICDIDGCVLDTEWIWRAVEERQLENDEMWDFFNRNANDLTASKPSGLLIDLVNGAMFSPDYELIFLTARSECIREATRKMLEYLFPTRQFILLMRPFENKDTSDIVKENHLKELIKNYEIKIAIDDDDSNLEMFDRYGVHCMKWDLNEEKEKTYSKLAGMRG